VAEKLLKVKGVFDPGDVQTGLQALTANMREMGKASLEVGGSKDAWASLGTAIEKMRPDLANVATVAYETAKAMDGIGRSGANFTQIEAGVGKATGYLKILKDAMAEAERAGVEIGPAVKLSIEKMEQGIAGAAQKAKVLRESFQGVVPPETAKDVDALSAALTRMEKASDSPKTLMRAAAAAKIELDEMRDAAERLGQVTPQMAQKFADAEQKINAAAGKARTFADAAGDLATRGNLAAQGMEAMAGRAGSVEGVLGLMKDTGGKTAQVLADIGFSVIAANQALELGKKALDFYKASLKDLENAAVGFQDKMSRQQEEMDKYDAALAAVSKGLISAGSSVKEMTSNYDAYIANTQRAAATTDLFAKSIDGIKVPKSFDEFSTEAVKLNVVMANAFKEGGDRFREFAKENESALNAIAERYRRNGTTIPEYIAKGIKANEDAAKAEAKYQKAVEDGKHAQEDKLKGMVAVFEKQQEVIKQGESLLKQEKDGSKTSQETTRAMKELAAQYGLTEEGLRDLIKGNEDYKRSVDEARGVGSVISPEALQIADEYIAKMAQIEAAHQRCAAAASQHRQVLNDLSNAMVQNGASGTGLKDIQEAMADSIAAGHEPVVKMQMLMVKLTEATEGQMKALKDLGGAAGEFAGNVNMMDDYLANLLSGFQSGMTSAFVTIEQINTVLTQFESLLAKNMGTKFEAQIREAIAAYEDLRNRLQMGMVQKEEQLKT